MSRATRAPAGRPEATAQPNGAPEGERRSVSRAATAEDTPLRIALVNDFELVLRGLEGMLRPFSDRLVVIELDTEANPATPARFGIRGIPTLIVFEHGQEVKRQVGAVQAADLEKLLPSLASAKA